MSLEVLIIVCLPLMGFTGEPLTYEANFDKERPFQREIALRLLRAIDPKRACNNLAFLEFSLSCWLGPEFAI